MQVDHASPASARTRQRRPDRFQFWAATHDLCGTG